MVAISKNEFGMRFSVPKLFQSRRQDTTKQQLLSTISIKDIIDLNTSVKLA